MTVLGLGIIVSVSMMEGCKVMLIVQKNNVKINREVQEGVSTSVSRSPRILHTR